MLSSYFGFSFTFIASHQNASKKAHHWLRSKDVRFLQP